MMTATAPVETPEHTEPDDDGLTHLFCPCSEDWALCGADVSEDPVSDVYAPEEECVVCVDLEWKPCQRCGT